MKINGYEIAIPEEKLAHMVQEEMLPIEMVNMEFEGYKTLPEGDKKALAHLVAAAKIMNDVALEQDHPLNRTLKKGLEEAANGSEYAANALKIFNSLNGVTGLNGVDQEPVKIFAGVEGYKGRNFYPTDLSVEEFHKIIAKMLDKGKTDEVRKILSARTMVRRSGNELKAVDYTEYFAKEFSAMANELEVAAHYATDDLFKDYLGWQAQAFLQNNEDMDMLADRHWAQMQDTNLEFTVSRENYDDEMTPTICENAELSSRLAEKGIEVVSKDMLGIRVGIVNKKGTELILKFKEQMGKLAKLMPYSDSYVQSVAGGGDVNQTMVDADLVALTGDYAQCRGAITTAQNLPNNDKLSVKTGGGRRNVYHRQVRQSHDKAKTQRMLDALVAKEFHQYFNPEAEHIFVIGHENGHSLGPNSEYQNALGVYKHTIEENKADVVSITFMPEYVKAGVITEETLKQVYATWIIRLFLKAKPQLIQPHRVGDLIHFNFLREHGAISFDADNKLVIHFDKMNEAMHKILDETIAIQLSKSPEKAKAFIDRYSTWSDISEHIAKVQKELGIKPYKDIRTYF
ncbi:MAG: hypothetical protein ACI4OW_05530 [Alphaproteobacteria bacterium]